MEGYGKTEQARRDCYIEIHLEDGFGKTEQAWRDSQIESQ